MLIEPDNAGTSYEIGIVGNRRTVVVHAVKARRRYLK
jgi:hypothetical protein